MSVQDTQARLATLGEKVIVPADAGRLACLAAIDDPDYIIRDEVVLKSGVTEAASPSFDLFKDCDSSEKLAAVLYGSRPNVVLVGEWTEYDKIQGAIRRLLTDLPMLDALSPSCLSLSAMKMTKHRFSIEHSPSTPTYCSGVKAAIGGQVSHAHTHT